MKDSLLKSIAERIKIISGHSLRQSIYKYSRKEPISEDEMSKLMLWVNSSKTRKEIFASIAKTLSNLNEIDELSKNELVARFAEKAVLDEQSSSNATKIQAIRIMAYKDAKREIDDLAEQLILDQRISRTMELIVRPTIYFLSIILIIAIVLKLIK